DRHEHPARKAAMAMTTVAIIGPEDLVGSAEAAEIAGMNQSTFQVYSGSGRTPEPFVRLRCGSIWLREEITAWAAERTSQRGAGRGEGLAARRMLRHLRCASCRPLGGSGLPRYYYLSRRRTTCFGTPRRR